MTLQTKLTRADLLSLEQYAESRAAFRARVMAHKANRRVPIGPHLNLYFEDRLTIQYQVQEMLRIEKIFEAEGIAGELDAYNPLIPDGSNLKCTAMLEFPDVDQRRRQLALLRGVEDRIWLQVEGCERLYPIANEDLGRSNDEKTAAVHFLRFELSVAMMKALRNGAALSFGVSHDLYPHTATVSAATRAALLLDLADS